MRALDEGGQFIERSTVERPRVEQNRNLRAKHFHRRPRERDRPKPVVPPRSRRQPSEQAEVQSKCPAYQKPRYCAQKPRAGPTANERVQPEHVGESENKPEQVTAAESMLPARSAHGENQWRQRDQ